MAKEIDELNDDENQLKAMFARITWEYFFPPLDSLCNNVECVSRAAIKNDFGRLDCYC